jgi:hypothetical protein
MVNGIRGHLKMLASGRNGFTCEHTNSRAANALSLPLLLPLEKIARKKCACSYTLRLYRLFTVYVWLLKLCEAGGFFAKP